MTNDGTVLACVSWNIHRGRGEDGVVDAARTLDVLAREVCGPGTELLVLQEADEERPPHRGVLDPGAVAARTGLASVHDAPRARWGTESLGFLGVACFVGGGWQVEEVTLLDLPGHCHRGAVVVDLRREGVALRVIATHLSLTQPLRIAQMRILGQHMLRRAPRPTLICGDLNEWRPWGGLAFSRAVLGQRFAGPARASFPVRRPILPLDRMLGGGGAEVARVRVLDGPGIRMASDHRPVAAEVVLPAAGVCAPDGPRG